MAKLIITLLIIITIITVLVLIGSKAKKWPAITITSLLVVELILCIYRNKSEFFHQITGMEIVLVLLILWILSIAPHAEETSEPPKKPSNTRKDKDDKAGSDSSLF